MVVPLSKGSEGQPPRSCFTDPRGFPSFRTHVSAVETLEDDAVRRG